MLTLSAVAILVLAALAHLSGGRVAREGGSLQRLLESRLIIGVVFVSTFVVLWYSWAGWTPAPVVHDELAYVFQAQVFARGMWALPAQPFPEFWTQPHILVEPMVAAKYFPGHALVLALGALAGWMPLVPLLLQAGGGVLVYALARRVSSGGVALLTWIIWLFTPMVLFFGPSYFSEGTTAICWLAGWYALAEWRSTRKLPWLLAVALFTGWCTITRPLTGLAFAIPVGFVVLRQAAAERRWSDLALATLVGIAVLGIVPLWSAHTTGNWRVTPVALYTQYYLPFDVPGFGAVALPPARALPPHLAHWVDSYASLHATHVPARLPAILGQRLLFLFTSTWGMTSGVLGVFALLGLFTASAEVAFAVGSSLLLIIVYLAYATPARWTLYYFESTPALAYLTAAGLAAAAAMIGRPAGTPPSPGFRWSSPRWTGALVGVALSLLLPGMVAVSIVRRQHTGNMKYLRRFDGLLASVHDPRAVMFVRHAESYNPLGTFVRNVANPDTARIWVVHDRGDAENARLLAVAHGRRAYLFDERQGRTYDYEARTAP